jgi:hypothetical protein
VRATSASEATRRPDPRRTRRTGHRSAHRVQAVRRYPDHLCLLIVARPSMDGPMRAATAAIRLGMVSMGAVSVGAVSTSATAAGGRPA